MNQHVQQIADRIKELRDILEIDKKELCDHVGVSEDQYDLYENAKEDIPIGVLYAIAAYMAVDPTVLLTGDAPRMAEYTVVRKGKGVKVERYKGYDFSSLAFNFQGREMEPMIVHVNEDARPQLVTHGGQEFNIVLSGVVRITIGRHSFDLAEGDSIYFNPAIPHGQTAVGGDAEFLTIINEK